MGSRFVVSAGVLFGAFVFVGNVLLIVDYVSRGQSYAGAAVAAVIGGAIAAGCIWARSLEWPGDIRDTFGRAHFESDRKAAEKAGLE